MNEKKRKGRPPKPEGERHEVQIGMKLTKREHEVLLSLVASENARMVAHGFEPTATTGSVLRRIIEGEAARRGGLLSNGQVGQESFKGPSIPLGPNLEPLVEGAPKGPEEDSLAGWDPDGGRPLL